MASTYIPSNDSDFNEWLTRFMIYVAAHAETLGLTFDELDLLTVAAPEFATAMTAYGNARAIAKSTRATKDDKRTKTEAALKPLVARIQSFAGTTNADREALGIPIHGSGVSLLSGIEMSDDKPAAIIDIR